MKVWDLHCDTLLELRRAEKAGAPKSFLHNDLHIDLEKLQQAKQSLADTVTGTADGAILSMRPDELLQLLEGSEG